MKNFNKFQYSKWTVHNTSKGEKKGNNIKYVLNISEAFLVKECRL